MFCAKNHLYLLKEALYNLFQARKKLVEIFQSIVDDRRERREKRGPGEKKDMMDILLEVEDENGRKLNDEEIIDVLVMYLNAGHESSGHITMWATYFLQKHPEIFRKAKVAKSFHFWKHFSIFTLKVFSVS